MKHLHNKWSFKVFFNIFLNKVRGTIISKKKKISNAFLTTQLLQLQSQQCHC